MRNKTPADNGSNFQNQLIKSAGKNSRSLVGLFRDPIGEMLFRVTLILTDYVDS